MKFISHKIKKIPLLLILKGMRFMGMEIPPKATVSVLIHDKKNKILMLKLSYKDGYSLPGGSVKEGETFERAAMREFAEEVGGKITDLKYLGSFVGKKGNYSNLHVCFKAKIVKNKLKSSYEGKPEWISLEKAEKLSVFEDVRKAILKYKSCIN